MKEVGVGSRCINFLVDTIIVALISYGLYKWNNFYVYYWQHKYYPYWMFFYSFVIIYYFIFEAIFSRSPGKWLSISKVTNLKGEKPSILQVIGRSLLRVIIVEMFFIPFFDRPLHDQLTKTRVVEA